jgi:hypothetical protein
MKPVVEAIWHAGSAHGLLAHASNHLTVSTQKWKGGGVGVRDGTVRQTCDKLRALPLEPQRAMISGALERGSIWLHSCPDFSRIWRENRVVVSVVHAIGPD